MAHRCCVNDSGGSRGGIGGRQLILWRLQRRPEQLELTLWLQSRQLPFCLLLQAPGETRSCSRGRPAALSGGHRLLSSSSSNLSLGHRSDIFEGSLLGLDSNLVATPSGRMSALAGA